MKKYILISTIVFLLLLIVFFICKGIYEKRLVVIEIKGQTIYAYIADAPAKQTKGLMFKKDLKENYGMFFIHDKEYMYPYWMKDTYIPLDIIWIDSNYKVVHIAKNTLPCMQEACKIYSPARIAKYVLEVNGGWSDTYDLNIGDTINLKDYVLFAPLK